MTPNHKACEDWQGTSEPKWWSQPPSTTRTEGLRAPLSADLMERMKLPRCEHEGQGRGAANATPMVGIVFVQPTQCMGSAQKGHLLKRRVEMWASAALLSNTPAEHSQRRSMVRKQSEIPRCSPGPPAHVDTRLAEAATSLMGGGPTRKAISPSRPCPSSRHTSQTEREHMLTGQLATPGDTHTVWKDACLTQEYLLIFFLPVTLEPCLQLGL